MTPFHNPTIRIRALLFILLFTQILEDVGFELDLALAAQIPHSLINVSSWAKHYNHVFGPMMPPVPAQ